MKASELRIGNWVRYRDKKDCIVTNLGSKGFEAVEPYNMFVYGSDDLDEFKPITLTKEWLIKFGFKKDDFFSGQMIAYGLVYSPRYSLKKIVISLQSDINNDFFILLDYGTKIQYVHQLQNLYFASTGEELEINS